MDTFFEYLTKSALWLTAFYVVFRFGLQKTTFHDFKRFFLLAGMVAAFVMPFVIIYRTVPSHAITGTAVAENGFATVIDTPTTIFNLKNTLLIIYTLIALILSARYIISIVRIIKAIQHNETHQQQQNIILTNHSLAPFSFGKYIFIPKNITSPQELELILKHESIHTAERHYIDLWVSKFLCVIQFFNPIAWLYARAIQENCEYIADHKTLRSTDFKQAYLNILIKYSLGQNFNPVSLHFASPLIFKRITIMKQEKSNKWIGLKSLLVLPLACVILVGYAQTKEVKQVAVSPQTKKAVSAPQKIEPAKQVKKEATSTQPAEKEDTDKEKPSSVVVVGYGSASAKTKAAENNEVFTIAETLPKFPGEEGALNQYLAANIKYPVNAQKNGTQGRVIAQFIVEKDGSITSVTIMRSVDPLLDAEACRVIYNMPKWIPGQQRGEVVRVKYTIPITFKLN